ncbi:MAG TPA: hypothetical protein VFW96_24160 [Thermomicrobiales bacterium]|nr:hypothetical protein [Thermomicrobiales bacterium]
METEPRDYGTEYRLGFRHGVEAIVRGLLSLDADQLDAGALIGALSRYERDVEAWRDAAEPAAPPAWQPSDRELSVES